MSSTTNDDTAQPTPTRTDEKAPKTVAEQEEPETTEPTETESKETEPTSQVNESDNDDTKVPGLSEVKEQDGNGNGNGEEGAAGDDENPPLPDEPVPTQNEWQAIWSPAHNAYYFYNSRTAETTWVNPLEPSASADTPSDPTTASTSTSTQPQPAQPPLPAATEPEEKPPQDLSYLNGIDPELAYLDPTLAVPSGGAKGPVPTFSARFGARSGKFTAMDGRQPEHLSEAARAQRMSSVYFDTAAWEREIAERDAQAKAEREAGVGDKRKRVTKADIERFKAQKQAKKAMRNAWLRE